jgi:hypothetical protein
MTDKQIEAVAAANELVGLGNQIRNLNVLLVSITNRASLRAYQTAWNALDTYSYNANGSQGATDGTPTSGHPIVGANIAASDLATILDIVQKYQDCGNNVAVAASARVNTLNGKLN